MNFTGQLYQLKMPVIRDISVSAIVNGKIVIVSQLMGLLDTGASRTVLGQGVVNQLGLIPDSWDIMNTPKGKNVNASKCLISSAVG